MNGSDPFGTGFGRGIWAWATVKRWPSEHWEGVLGVRLARVVGVEPTTRGGSLVEAVPLKWLFEPHGRRSGLGLS